MECIFCRIIAGKSSARIFFEDESTIVFHDIAPKAPIHLLICPKEHYPDFLSAPPDIHAQLAGTVVQVSRMLAEKGSDFRIQVNNGPGSGQIVFHLHYHFLAWG